MMVKEVMRIMVGMVLVFFCELYSCRMLFVLVMVMVMGVVAYKRRSHREVQLYSFIFS